MRKARQGVFHLESMAQLSVQLLRAPHEHQLQHLERAEKLHDEMLPDPEGMYPLAYVLFRITGVKAMYPTGETLFGRGITHDLREIIDRLSKNLRLVCDPGQGCLDTQALAREKKVATRTIARWREDGLRWRWGFLKEGSYFQVVFPASAVAAYETSHAQKVAYATSFTQLSSDELRALFNRARRLAEATGAQPFTVARHLARRTGRTTEALRRILVKHDLAEKPQNRIFRDYTAALSQEQRNDIYRAWLARTRTGEITRRHKRTRATIYRVVSEKRVEAAAALAKPWHPLPTLERDDAAQVFLSTPLAQFIQPAIPQGPSDLPDVLGPFFVHPPLKKEAASHLLFRINYLNYRLDSEIKAVSTHLVRVSEVESIEALSREAQVCRAIFVRACLPWVHSLANRHLGAKLSGPLRQSVLLRLIDLALPVLNEAIDSFDLGGHIPFERYFSNRLLQRYASLKMDPSHSQVPLDELADQVRSQIQALTQTAPE